MDSIFVKEEESGDSDIGVLAETSMRNDDPMELTRFTTDNSSFDDDSKANIDRLKEELEESLNNQEERDTSWEQSSSSRPKEKKKEKSKKEIEEEEREKMHMTQRQVEMRRGLLYEPSCEDYAQQIEAVYLNENNLWQRLSHVEEPTPEPTNDPLCMLKAVAAYMRNAARESHPMVRTTQCDAGMLVLAEITRWLPPYHQIARERDHLLTQVKAQEGIKQQRDALQRQLLEQEALVWELQQEVGSLKQQPEKTKQEQNDGTSSTDGSNSTRSTNPSPPPTPQRELTSPGLDNDSETEIEENLPMPVRIPKLIFGKSPSPATMGVFPPTKVANMKAKPINPMQARAPMVVLKRVPITKGPMTNPKARFCPVCQQKSNKLVKFRCRACKEFWQRQRTKHRMGQELPECCSDHKKNCRPLKCGGCRRLLYEKAFRRAYPGYPLSIPSLLPENGGSQDGGGCEPSGLTGLFPLTGAK